MREHRIGGCGGGELFTVTPGGGPGSEPQMNSSCRRRSRLKQTAPRAGRASCGGLGAAGGTGGHPQGAARKRLCAGIRSASAAFPALQNHPELRAFNPAKKLKPRFFFSAGVWVPSYRAFPHPCPRPPLSPPAPFGRSLPAGRLSARPLPLGPRGTLDSLFPGSGSTMRSCFSGRWPARPPSLPPRAHAFPPTSSLPLLLRSLFLKSLKQMRQRDSQPPGQRLPSSPPLDAPISSSFPRACPSALLTPFSAPGWCWKGRA